MLLIALMEANLLQPYFNDMQLFTSSSRLDPSHINKTSYQVVQFPFGQYFNIQSYKLLDDYGGIEFFGKRTSQVGIGAIYTSDLNVCILFFFSSKRFLKFK